MKATKILLAATIAALLSLCTTRAAISLSGDVTTTGGTFEITQDITLTITTAGNVWFLAFSDWVTNSDSFSYISLSPTTLSYKLNGVTYESSQSMPLYDNNAVQISDLGPNDGFMSLATINVSQGDTLTILSGTWTTSGNPDFNPEAIQTFTGDVFVTDGSGNALSALTPVPEPSTWAALAGISALGLALVYRRRSK